MKKQILLFVLSLLPMMAIADDSGTCGDNVTYTYVESTHTLTISGAGVMADYYYYYNTPWRSYKSEIVKAIIKDGVKGIGAYAFYECSSLTSVTIPNSVTSIGELAFHGSGLTSVTIPNSVTSIGSRAFAYCSSLTSVAIPNSVTSIGCDAFWGCPSLTSISVESGNTKYDSRDNCKGIIETETNTLIAGCQNTTIPNSVTSIGNWAFYYCSSLTSIDIPNSVTSIGNEAFNGCSSLISVTIPNSVTSIGVYAFWGCSGLTSVTIGNSVTSIGNGAFRDCPSLASISVESGNTKYDSRDNCNGIIETETNNLIFGCQNTTIPNSVTSIGEAAFEYCSSLTSIDIPNSVTSIGNYAFAWCSGLTSVNIGNSVTSIGNRAFYKCPSLASISVESGNTKYDSRDNCNGIIETETNNLIFGCQNTTIPNSVTSIGNYAFEDCSSLTSITIPNSVTSIGNRVFSGCTRLTSVTMGNSVTSIGYEAFSYCGAITDFYCYAENIPRTGSSVFAYSNPDAILHVPNASIENYMNTSPWSGFGTIVGLSGSEPLRCATPIITYANGQVRFACETEDVEFVPTVTCTPSQLQNRNVLDIGGTFTVSVHATKEGYDNSDVATKTITINKLGDIDGDGQLTVTDVTSLVNAILGK